MAVLRTIIVSIAALFAMVGLANAQDAKKVENPWMECGIGAVIFPHTPVAAAISNIIWDLGTTAVTSQISSPESCEGTRTTAALFINRTYAELEAETARGQGEHLAAVGSILGCSASANDQLAARVRQDLAANMSRPEFAAKSRVEKAEAYFYSVDAAVTGDLAASCKAS